MANLDVYSSHLSALSFSSLYSVFGMVINSMSLFMLSPNSGKDLTI
nr:MAG TPA: hypothetical protein [Caudoviricetes sp.]